MNDWINAPIEQKVMRLTQVPAERRSAILAGDRDRATHRRHFDGIAALREIETGGKASRRHAIDGPTRVVFWNVERLRHIDAIVESLRSLRADVSLLCEVDRGMARTGNADRVAEIAERLDQAFVYAVEFVELGLGDRNEQHLHTGETNALGLHGAALLSDIELARPFLVRIEARGDWFDGSRHEPRVGGTIALGAVVRVEGTEAVMVNVHLESHGEPAERADDMAHMLTVIEDYARGMPVLLGGDFNTSTGSYADRWSNRTAWLQKLRREPERLTRPEAFEPLFACAARFGYEWQTCNVMGVATQRFGADDERPRAKLDWFFTRGLKASEPRIIPALRSDGRPSSDHDALVVTIAPRRAVSFDRPFR
jgi:endonuclease/exonuclease/phosphatase family metal-dependent hydrolase